MPGLTFGQGDIFVLSGYAGGGVADGVPDSGSSVLNVLPGTPSIQIDLVCDVPMGAIGVAYSLTADRLAPVPGGPLSGDFDWIYPVNSWTIGPMFALGAWLGSGAGYPSALGSPAQNIEPGPLGAAHPISFQGPFDFSFIGVPGGEYLLASYTLVPAAPLVLGQSWAISAQQTTPVVPFNNGITTLMGSGFTAGSLDLIVNVVPEPTTALLLLGALPFLRRRR
ncbi:MAG: hypothetical protein ACYTBZ_02690 [Planctomycetota bacterium]